MHTRVRKLYTKNWLLNYGGSCAVLPMKSKIVTRYFLRLDRLPVFILGRCFLLVVLAGLHKYNNSGGSRISLTRPSNRGLFGGFFTLNECASTLKTLTLTTVWLAILFKRLTTIIHTATTMTLSLWVTQRFLTKGIQSRCNFRLISEWWLLLVRAF